MAIIASKGRPPDALVTDWWMPESPPDGRLDRGEEGPKQAAGELMLKFTNNYNMVRILYSWEANAVIAKARKAAFHRRVAPCTKETSLLLFTLQDEFAHPRRWSRESIWPKLDRP
jgi:hypothetical protein